MKSNQTNTVPPKVYAGWPKLFEKIRTKIRTFSEKIRTIFEKQFVQFFF